MPRQAESIAEVVRTGLCIGCGLCESVSGGRVTMTMTRRGSLRPAPADAFSSDEESTLLNACPGAVATPRTDDADYSDPVWGDYYDMRYAWAGSPDVRFRAAAAGVLTALGMYLIDSGRAKFVYQVGADPERPMRNRWYMSETSEEVLNRAGSRYAPTSPLAGLGAALDRNEPFAIIAKPCDLNAVHNYSQSDPRINENCVARLTMICGGQSRFSKSQLVLDEAGIDESEVTLFRYRGYGNPGMTHVETRSGRVVEKTYAEQWSDESTWDLETRCKLCPDPLGEASDIAVGDVWPNATPIGEDEGFSGVIARTRAGLEMLSAGSDNGHVVLEKPIAPREFDSLQPHQVRKKHALAHRYAALDEAGLPTIATPGLRIDKLGKNLDNAAAEREKSGTRRRIDLFSEPLVDTHAHQEQDETER